MIFREAAAFKSCLTSTWRSDSSTRRLSSPPARRSCLLAGDIGRLVDYDAFLSFLEMQASRFSKVLLVLGNHEFYGLDYEMGLKEARRLVAEPRLNDKVVLLDKARWDDPDSKLTVLGCTLWSAIPEDKHEMVLSNISDYRKMRDWTPHRHNEVHLQEATWLKQQVAQSISEDRDGRRLLVATHHAPCLKGTSKPEHQENQWTPAFATDMLVEGDWDGVHTWVFGHTHYTTTFKTNNVQVVTNQRGYVFPGSTKEVTAGRKKLGIHDFDASRTITVKRCVESTRATPKHEKVCCQEGGDRP